MKPKMEILRMMLFISDDIYLHTPIKKFMIVSSTSLARFRNRCGEHHWMNFVLPLAS